MTPRDLERAKEIVLANVNRELKAEAEHHGYTHKPIGCEAFEFVHHAALAKDIAAAIADEREANAKVCESKLCEFGVIVPGSVPPRRIAPGEMDWNVALTEAASAIRARGGA